MQLLIFHYQLLLMKYYPKHYKFLTSYLRPFNINNILFRLYIKNEDKHLWSCCFI